MDPPEGLFIFISHLFGSGGSSDRPCFDPPEYHEFVIIGAKYVPRPVSEPKTVCTRASHLPLTGAVALYPKPCGPSPSANRGGSWYRPVQTEATQAISL